jgi:hypothetical protein
MYSDRVLVVVSMDVRAISIEGGIGSMLFNTCNNEGGNGKSITKVDKLLKYAIRS